MDSKHAQDIEVLAAKFHEIYQQEAKRQGDVRHKDNYADLPENIKEFDRVLARYVADALAAEAERVRRDTLEEAAQYVLAHDNLGTIAAVSDFGRFGGVAVIKKIIIGLIFAMIPVTALMSIRRANAQAYPVIHQEINQYDVEHEKLNYFWDERTGLCFASATFITAYGARVTTFTNVPCTEKVWVLIRGGK